MSPFKSILVPVDFSEPSTHALRLAIDIAKRFRSAMTLLHTWEIPAYVYPGIEIAPADLFPSMKDAAQAELDRVLANVTLEVPSARAVFKIGTPWRETLATINELTPDLVVMGTHGRRGLGRVLLGSVTEKIVRTSPSPVLTVGPQRTPSGEESEIVGTFKHVLVPTDFGEASAEALDLALDLAAKFDAKITLVHSAWVPAHYYPGYAEGLAWPTGELEAKARTELEAAVVNARARHPKIDGALVTGEASERILEVSKEERADLIVMGTHGHRGLSRVLLGSVAEKVVRLSAVPVLTVSAEAQRRARVRTWTENVLSSTSPD